MTDHGGTAKASVIADDLRMAVAGAPHGPAELPHRLARSLGRLTYARRFRTETLLLLPARAAGGRTSPAALS